MNRVLAYIEHIREAARLALSYTEGMQHADFLADTRTQQAVVMNLIIIGEAATKLLNENTELAACYPQVAWRNMRGMRNRLAHGYFEIDMDIVWDTVHNALPDLILKLNTVSSDTQPS
ncbi:MAG TPA: DUF86 domain-containing protein [bacterium]|nr:DUF86 domain-containing protein [bacterium]